MVPVKNYETMSNFDKVMQTFFWTWCR